MQYIVRTPGGGNLNIRSGPGQRYRVIGNLRQGTRINIIPCRVQSQWSQLESGGWVYSNYIVPATAGGTATGGTATAVQEGAEAVTTRRPSGGSLLLMYFPVQVPAGFDIERGRVPLPRGRSGMCPGEIEFGDDYDNPRRGGRHRAIDIFGAIGLRIVATTNGEVLTSWRYKGTVFEGAGYSERGGWYVRMRDNSGNIHYYCHLRERPRVRNGDTVRAGQILGYLGQTGAAATTCPHLHYQVMHGSPWNPGRGGEGINPYRQLLSLFRS